MTCSPCLVATSRLPSGEKAAEAPSSSLAALAMPGIASAAEAPGATSASMSAPLTAASSLVVNTNLAMESTLRVGVESVVLLVGQVIDPESGGHPLGKTVGQLGIEGRKGTVAAVGI